MAPTFGYLQRGLGGIYHVLDVECIEYKDSPLSYFISLVRKAIIMSYYSDLSWRLPKC